MIANISHDLKTPVTVISGYVDALADGKISPSEQGRYLAAIRSRTESLTGLINAFHEYSKVDHPQFSLQRRELDLCEYLREYLAGQYDTISLAGFALEVSIPETPCRCSLDPFQFGRALDNLIGNALRYNRLGTLLTVTLEPGPESVLLTVADNGEGVPPERAGPSSSPLWWAATPAARAAAGWGFPSPGGWWSCTAAPSPWTIPPAAGRLSASVCPESNESSPAGRKSNLAFPPRFFAFLTNLKTALRKNQVCPVY